MPPLVAISPHLDDAVFGCGALLTTQVPSVVITVFAGRPPRRASLPPWDEAAGFHPGDDVVDARRAEDRAALDTLGARPVWLNFLDAQYGDSPSADSITAALERVLAAADPATVCVPLGLFHSDHELALAAALSLVLRFPSRRWLAYEEPMYRRIPHALDARLTSLREAGLQPTAIAGAAAPESKRRAVACYASQLRALDTPGRAGHADALTPERYWALTA